MLRKRIRIPAALRHGIEPPPSRLGPGGPAAAGGLIAPLTSQAIRAVLAHRTQACAGSCPSSRSCCLSAVGGRRGWSSPVRAPEVGEQTHALVAARPCASNRTGSRSREETFSPENPTTRVLLARGGAGHRKQRRSGENRHDTRHPSCGEQRKPLSVRCRAGSRHQHRDPHSTPEHHPITGGRTDRPRS